MTTSLSSKGQIVLPAKVRRALALSVGEKLEVTVEHAQGRDRIVLTKNAQPRRKLKIVIDPVTKFPMLKMPPGTPKLTSAMVKAMLADFP